MDHNPMITLSPAEALLRSLLLDCRASLLAQNPPPVPHLDMYIVGGWVRDRLLHLPDSHDIDIALSSMTGIQFARALNPFAATHHKHYQQRAAELGLPTTTTTTTTIRFHEVPQNPAMSKRLDTAVGRAFGLDVDLVNLRREAYEGDSRKPSMTTFGTAQEDALRRDATVNALFVHLETLDVLDFTGQGLRDLRDRVMRTPLEPRRTFLEDPLRVLRLIRIGSALGFAIEEEALAEMKRREIHEALCLKVTRERLSVETVKMLESEDPQAPLQLVFQSNLYASVFLSSSLTGAMARVWPQLETQPWPPTWPVAYHTLAEIAGDSESGLQKLTLPKRDPAGYSWDGFKARLWLMAIYAPVTACLQRQAASLKDIVDDIKTAVSLTSRATSLLAVCFRNFDSVTAMVDRIAEPGQVTRSDIGMAIRSWGETWRLQVLFAFLSSLATQTEANLHKEVRRRYERFVDVVEEQHLWDAHSLKPILDGHSLMSVLGVSRGGRYLKEALDEQVAFQFDNPSASVDDVKAWAAQQRDSWLSHET